MCVCVSVYRLPSEPEGRLVALDPFSSLCSPVCKRFKKNKVSLSQHPPVGHPVPQGIQRQKPFDTSPLCCLCLFTLNQAAAAYSSSSVSFHTACWCCRAKRCLTGHIITLTSVGGFCVSSPRFPPVNLIMYWPAIYKHRDAVIMCCDWDSDPPCIMESDKVAFFCSNWHYCHQWIADPLTREKGWSPWSLGRERSMSQWFFSQ